MGKLRCFFCLMIIGSTASGQQQGSFSSATLYNPLRQVGWMPNESGSHVFALHRSQWLGFQNSFSDPSSAPVTDLVSFVTEINSSPLGYTGLQLRRDKLGAITNTSISWLGGLRFSLKRATWAVGLQPTIIFQNLNSDLLRSIQSNDPVLNGLVSENDVRDTRYDLNFGTSLVGRKYKIGIGVSNLLNSKSTFTSDSVTNVTKSLFSLNFGVTKKLAYRLNFIPEIAIRTDMSSFSGEVNALFQYKSDYYLAASYKHLEGVTLAFSMAVGENKLIRFGTAFDLVAFNTRGKAFLSSEFFIKYGLPNIKIGSKKPVKTPRHPS